MIPHIVKGSFLKPSHMHGFVYFYYLAITSHIGWLHMHMFSFSDFLKLPSFGDSKNLFEFVECAICTSTNIEI